MRIVGGSGADGTIMLISVMCSGSGGAQESPLSVMPVF